MHDLNERLRAHLLNRSFGALYFWGFAPLRPHDDAFDLVSTHLDGDRLDLVFVHSSRRGLASVLSIVRPEGLSTDERGLRIARAAHLRMDDLEAAAEGELYALHGPRGVGRFPMDGAAALTIGF